MNVFSRNFSESAGAVLGHPSFSRPLPQLCQYNGYDWISACRTCSLSPWRLTCITPVAWCTHWQTQLPARIKVESTPGTNAGSIEQTCNEMDRCTGLTESDRMIEKSKNARGERGGKGSGLAVETSVHFSVRWWMSDRSSDNGEQSQIDADLCHP